MLICTKDNNSYIGQTSNLRLRSNNSKSWIRHAKESPYKYPAHFSTCSNNNEPYFRIFPFYYIDEQKQREFIERRFILKYKPTLNGKK